MQTSASGYKVIISAKMTDNTVLKSEVDDCENKFHVRNQRGLSIPREKQLKKLILKNCLRDSTK